MVFSCLKTSTFFILLLLAQACTKKLPNEINENSTPTEIIELGDNSFKKGYYEQAGDYYSAVNKYFPYSSEDEYGLRRAVEAYFEAKRFEDVRITATKFLTTYPESTKSETILYLRSKSYCMEIDIVERDQAAAKNCIEGLGLFKKLYPRSKLLPEVELNIVRAREFLVGQQLNVGKYYLKRNNPTAAMKRFKKVKKSLTRSDFSPEISYRLIESFLMLGLIDEAFKENIYMRKNFPKNIWTSKAENLIEKSGSS